MATVARTSKYTYRSSGGTSGNADVSIEYSADLSALSRLEDKIRLLQDDLEIERELRSRIEREKADLSVQVIQLSERLEEAEGGAESQFEINKKRDTELLKLRKLLEDVHIESEETAAILKRKHQEIVVDFQEQIDTLAKSKSRAEKEKGKFQAEVYELLAQVETLNKERFISVKHAEKLEITISELNVRIEELNRTIVDITSHKQRLSSENIELVKEVQDLKVSLENASYLKTQLAGQLEDARRRAEDDERRRSILEAQLHQVEVELESIRVQLEEESEARLDLERQLVKSQGDCQVYKAKYESEAAARAEEIEELRRKYNARISEQEEHIESLLVKVNNLEKQKSRLQSEVEVLIIDLEKANGTARELQKRVEHLERINIEIKTRLEETVQLYESTQRDLRNKQQELQRVVHELDKTREQRDQLARENKKLADDLNDAKNTLSEYNRRLHELELELRRLENERDELTAAYKEAEAGRRAEEQRAQRLAAELAQFRHEAEKRLQEKDDEIDAIRWQPQTRKYEYNYGLGINFYQPMIDYIEDKAIRGARAKSPHLPWANEKALKEFDPMRSIKTYSNEELQKLARKTEASAKEKLRNAKSFSKTGYQLSQTVSAATITEKVQIRKTEKKKKDILRQIKSVQERMKDDNDDYDPEIDRKIAAELRAEQKFLRGKSAKAIEQQLLYKSRKNINENVETKQNFEENRQQFNFSKHNRIMEDRMCQNLSESFEVPLENLSAELKSFDKRSQNYYQDKSKATSIEIEQLNARVVEAETKLKTEVTRIKKKLQIQITELEMSLDTVNKTNIDLQKTIKKQSLQLTEIQAHYDEIQRQLQVTLDQLSVSQRRVQALTAEAEEIRGNYESALRGKRQAEQQVEEYSLRINELTTFNVNLASAKSKIEQELTTVVADYDEITKELRISDERYQRVQVELKHTVELLHEEQERVVKIEAIKKSLEIEIKNLSVRLEEVEANAIVGGKRIISKLEARLRDLEAELDEEKRRHAETIKILRKKERTVKEVMIQCEEDQKNIALLQETLEKSNQKVNLYKRQLQEQEGVSQQNVTRVRRFQRELEAAEDRAENAESSLSLIRTKHRSFVTSSSVPGSQVYLVQETTTRTSEI